eukprot:TRINITY_DN68095_c3_g3_i7.p2 TRINITY_DN68095_c3_g3~~TRINITY_DN68095_c3_g3_i7.p2  ORF type:complete len:110 (-),score=21.29 TRINITY_DN68095_c3_g3_i7:63-392(-)
MKQKAEVVELQKWIDEHILCCWSVRAHHQFPLRYRLMCGVALWCMSSHAPPEQQQRDNKKKRTVHKKNTANHRTVSSSSVFVPVEVTGLMFCFWSGDVFAPTINGLDRL